MKTRAKDPFTVVSGSASPELGRVCDVLRGLVKSLVFAVIIVAIGSYQGLNTRGGAAGVGKATTGAVVTSIILIFIFNFALSYILFRQNG